MASSISGSIDLGESNNNGYRPRPGWSDDSEFSDSRGKLVRDDSAGMTCS